MSDSLLSQIDVDAIFSQLDAQDVEQFYRHYQFWQFQQRIAALHAEIDALQGQLAVNREELEQVAPSPIALASLARLQLHGVTDPDLLDCLLEHGDEWLDRTIERLDYCERMDLIGGDYTQWCKHALDGAYDWIDSMSEMGGTPVDSPGDEALETDAIAGNDNDALPQTTEEMLLQRLMSEEEDQITLKVASVPPTPVLAETDTPVAEAPAETGETLDDLVPSEQVPLDEDTVPSERVLFDEEDALAPVADEIIPLPADSFQPSEADSVLVNETIAAPEQVQQEIEQVIAPSEQYELPEAFEDMTPTGTDDTPTQVTASSPQEEATSFEGATSPFTHIDQPVGAPTPTTPPPVVETANNVPVSRPPRQRNFWQKLAYVLLGK